MKESNRNIESSLLGTKLKFENFTDAWHGINEYLVNSEHIIRKRGGSVSGGILASYDNLVYVEDARMDKYFNFGKILGYQVKKWSKLLNNYCNYNYLDLVRNEIVEREKKKSSSYNYTYHFDNVHGSGKDCLISLTFTRRKSHPNPVVYFYTRASEVTKRLPFDFLLIQRMIEYIYGKKQRVHVVCHIPFMFINADCFLMYVSYKGVEMLEKKNGEYTDYQKKLIEKHQHFLNTPLEKIRYKVSQRAARQVHAWANLCEPLPDMFAKQLKLDETLKRKETHIARLNESM